MATTKAAHPKSETDKGEASGTSESQITVDHETIRKWVEARGGHPATVKRTEKHGEPGLLRIDYPGFSGETSLEEISWEAFFEKFEKENLAFLYQEMKDGKQSRFSKIIARPADLK